MKSRITLKYADPKLVGKYYLITWIAAVLAIIHSIYFAFATASQPLLDLHSFRQSQTALGAFWIDPSSNWLKYQLPVIGYPWSIPFEFPTYQLIVKVIHNFIGTPLIPTGRLISFVFLFALIIPLKMIVKDLKLSKFVVPIFILLLLSSSDYLYWSRAFMIETTAIFLSTLAIASYLRFLSGYKFIWFLATIIFGAFAGLTKSTSALTFLAFSSCAVIVIFRKRRDVPIRKVLALELLAIPSITYLIITWWINYSDHIKSLNPNGKALTSKALSKWNYGTFSQRFSGKFWIDLVIQRTILGNLGAGLGLFILIIFLIRRKNKNLKKIIYISVSMFVLPIIVFTNLHLVHWYYQVSCQIFLFFALAIASSYLIISGTRNTKILSLTGVLLVSILNFGVFEAKFSHFAYQKFTPVNSEILAIANFVKLHTNRNDNILIYGQDWSSSLAFASERKSATLPTWMPTYQKSYVTPSELFNGKNPGAIINCLPNYPNNVHPTNLELNSLTRRIGLKEFKRMRNCSVWYRN